MHRKRLQILQRKLRKFKESPGNLRFDLTRWIRLPHKYRDVDPVMAVAMALQGKNYCGTAACACGLAATIPSFKRDGFSVKLDDYMEPRPHFKGRDNVHATSAFFNLDYDTAGWLFDPRYYGRNRGPINVAQRIQKVLDGYRHIVVRV